MAANDKRKRRSRGSAWYWRQTDCWYYTPPGTKRRVPLVDEDGKRIRGKDNRQAAELALARVKVAGQWRPSPESAEEGEWNVAKVCSRYVQYCQRSFVAGSICEKHRNAVVRYLNQLCAYCGVLPVSQLTKGHVQHWVETQPTWRSPNTRRNAITTVLTALNHARDTYGVYHNLKGLKKPSMQLRLHSFSEEDETAIYDIVDEVFAGFLFAAIHTGLRPFCELACITGDDVMETDRGMMWRVYSSKTKKTRKIPVRREVAELARRLMESAPAGSAVPLFRNTQGNPWTIAAGGYRFIVIRETLGWGKHPVKKLYSCYTARHTFAHRMLSGYWNNGVGCSIETLAELMGNTPQVAFDHYGREWGQSYQDPLWTAIGVGKAD